MKGGPYKNKIRIFPVLNELTETFSCGDDLTSDDLRSLFIFFRVEKMLKGPMHRNF